MKLCGIVASEALILRCNRSSRGMVICGFFVPLEHLLPNQPL